MRILAIGDIVGQPGRRACAELVPRLREDLGLDLVIANGENSAGGFGITAEIGEQLFAVGIDVLTSGNHVLAKKGIEQYLDDCPRLLRPANWPPGTPGRGSLVLPSASGVPVGVLNLQGVVFMDPLDCPFRRGLEEVEDLRRSAAVIVIDFHAEATAEKIAFARHVAGRCAAVFGTHTHVQTADERVLAGGTALITDLGMTGPVESVIGMEIDVILKRFIYKMPARFEVAGGPALLCGAYVDVDPDSGRAVAIERVRVPAYDGSWDRK